MDIDKVMIFVSIVILVCVIGTIGLLSGEFGLPDVSPSIPQITSGTNTDNSGFYDYCSKMGLDC